MRGGNILVAGNEAIYIIDFESARSAAEAWLHDEMREVEKLFAKIRKEREGGRVEGGMC